MTSQRPHLLRLSHWALGFKIWISEGHKRSDHSTLIQNNYSQSQNENFGVKKRWSLSLVLPVTSCVAFKSFIHLTALRLSFLICRVNLFGRIDRWVCAQHIIISLPFSSFTWHSWPLCWEESPISLSQQTSPSFNTQLTTSSMPPLPWSLPRFPKLKSWLPPEITCACLMVLPFLFLFYRFSCSLKLET